MCKAVEKFEHLEEQTDKTDPESPGNFVGVENPVLEEVGSTASQSASSPAEMREVVKENVNLNLKSLIWKWLTKSKYNRFSEDEWKGSGLDGQQQSSSSFNMRSESGKAEGSQPCDSGIENITLGSVSHMESALGEDALEIPKFSCESDLIAGTSDQQESSEQADVLPEWFQSLTSEQSTASSQPALNEGTSQDPQAPLTRAPDRSSSSAPDSPASLDGCEEPLPSPPAESTELFLVSSPPAFPVADVD
ncbi:hypothetical protein ASZ78_016605 [Callipepla squamata]|uniref:Uncharacterized protein n=1 Tax=Callipepla squamata TaxID=9009 RepID=A0A226MC54_CALSU|nr:hypothetical protein ASZ78_016605 [Callipepla squamata]